MFPCRSWSTHSCSSVLSDWPSFCCFRVGSCLMVLYQALFCWSSWKNPWLRGSWVMSSPSNFLSWRLAHFCPFKAQTAPLAAPLAHVQDNRLRPLSVCVYHSASRTDAGKGKFSSQHCSTHSCFQLYDGKPSTVSVLPSQCSFYFMLCTFWRRSLFFFKCVWCCIIFSWMSCRSITFCSCDSAGPEIFNVGFYDSVLRMLLVMYFRLWLSLNHFIVECFADSEGRWPDHVCLLCIHEDKIVMFKKLLLQMLRVDIWKDGLQVSHVQFSIFLGWYFSFLMLPFLLKNKNNILKLIELFLFAFYRTLSSNF